MAAVLLAVSLHAQRIWTVDFLQRPGADFQDLPAAVAAASSGDIIRLRGTTTSLSDSYLAPSIQGKALTIVGDASVPPRPIVTGPWDIQGLAAGQSVVIKGIDLSGNNDPSQVPQIRPLRI